MDTNATAARISYDLDARQTNGLTDPDAYYARDFAFMTLRQLADAGGRITRVRWLYENKRADLSYIHGELPDGTVVHVQDQPAIFLQSTWLLKKDLVAWAKKAGVYALGIGLLDEGNWSKAW